MTVKDLIEGLQKARGGLDPEAVKKASEERKQAWIGSLRNLISIMESWLQPAADEGLLRLTRRESNLSALEWGEYSAPSADITDGWTVIGLEPGGAGGGTVEVDGGRHRVSWHASLVSGTNRVPLCQLKGGEWIAFPKRGSPRFLTEDVLAEILAELLGV